METISTDICVIGGGSGGLSVAAGAAQMGARVVLFEGGRMGGDCLNSGCVPSKALLAAAKAAHYAHGNPAMGITGAAPAVDFAAVKRHVAEVIATIAPHDSVARFTGLGVRVIEEHAGFAGPRLVRSTAGAMAALPSTRLTYTRLRVHGKRVLSQFQQQPDDPPGARAEQRRGEELAGGPLAGIAEGRIGGDGAGHAGDLAAAGDGQRPGKDHLAGLRGQDGGPQNAAVAVRHHLHHSRAR